MQIPILHRHTSSQLSQQYEGSQGGENSVYKSQLTESTNYSISSFQQYNNGTTTSKLYSSAASYRNNDFSQESIKNQNNICIQHIKQFNYICVTCSQNICSDCLYNPSKHRGHRFQRFTEKNKDLKGKCSEISAKINSKINYALQNIKNLQVELQHKKIQQQKHIQNLQNYAKSIRVQKIETPLQNQQAHNNDKHKCSQFSKFYDQQLTELIKTTKVGLITNKQKQIRNKICSKIKQVQQYKVAQVTQKAQNFIRPKFFTNIFALQNFTQRKKQNSQILLQEFPAYQSLWRVKVYPGGYGQLAKDERNRQVQYMSVYVQRLDGRLQRSEYLIQIEITSRVDPRLRIRKHFQLQYARNQSWGYDKYTRISNIFDHGFLGFDDTLFIKVNITPANYFEGIKAQMKVIEQKQQLQYENIKKINHLKNMIRKRKQQEQILKQKKQNNKMQVFKNQEKVEIITEMKQQNPQQKTIQVQNQKSQMPNYENAPNQQESKQQKTNQILIQQIPTAESQSPCPIQKIIHSIAQIKIPTKQIEYIKKQQWKGGQIQKCKYQANPKLKTQIKSKLDSARSGIIKINRNRTTNYPQISLEKSQGKLIRLVSLKNMELIQNSRKLLFNKSTTF